MKLLELFLRGKFRVLPGLANGIDSGLNPPADSGLGGNLRTPNMSDPLS